jgi:7,8-dihydropterin-6-yl-methyl-4-(beta-D-ribofuranosyl)aminobenzene 5'-phosphate synthase
VTSHHAKTSSASSGFHAESQRGDEIRNVLIDFGITPEVLLNNLAILKIDPASLDALVLSHGHYDHFGGLVGFLAATKGRLKANTPFFVGGEDCFCAREFGRGGNMGALDRTALRDADLSLMVSEGPSLVADHGFTSGPIALSSLVSSPSNCIRLSTITSWPSLQICRSSPDQ